MNFAIAYQEVGKFLQYRDVSEKQNIYIQSALGHLVVTGDRLIIKNKNTEQWYKDASLFILNLCVLGNVKGLLPYPVDHNHSDIEIIKRTAGILANKIYSVEVRFSLIAIPARSIYRLAPDEAKLNHELNTQIGNMFGRLPIKKIMQVSTTNVASAFKSKAKRLLVTTSTRA